MIFIAAFSDDENKEYGYQHGKSDIQEKYEVEDVSIPINMQCIRRRIEK
jgi:hypothetical protein